MGWPLAVRLVCNGDGHAGVWDGTLAWLAEGFCCDCCWHAGVWGTPWVWVAVRPGLCSCVLVCRGWSLSALWGCFNATCWVLGVEYCFGGLLGAGGAGHHFQGPPGAGGRGAALEACWCYLLGAGGRGVCVRARDAALESGWAG